MSVNPHVSLAISARMLKGRPYSDRLVGHYNKLWSYYGATMELLWTSGYVICLCNNYDKTNYIQDILRIYLFYLISFNVRHFAYINTCKNNK
jgi:hypothetical protein